MAEALLSAITQRYGYGPDMNKWINMSISLSNKLALVYEYRREYVVF
jgi:hypothetical protein